MAPAEHQANDFIPYPIDRVVGTMLDGTRARAAIEALLQRGVDPAHIDVLSSVAVGKDRSFLVCAAALCERPQIGFSPQVTIRCSTSVVEDPTRNILQASRISQLTRSRPRLSLAAGVECVVRSHSGMRGAPAEVRNRIRNQLPHEGSMGGKDVAREARRFDVTFSVGTIARLIVTA
jgi:hypothetical protein